MLVCGGLFVGVLLTNQTEFGKLIVALPGLVAMFVVAGAVIGHVTTMDDDDSYCSGEYRVMVSEKAKRQVSAYRFLLTSGRCSAR